MLRSVTVKNEAGISTNVCMHPHLWTKITSRWRAFAGYRVPDQLRQWNARPPLQGGTRIVQPSPEIGGQTGYPPPVPQPRVLAPPVPPLLETKQQGPQAVGAAAPAHPPLSGW